MSDHKKQYVASPQLAKRKKNPQSISNKTRTKTRMPTIFLAVLHSA